MSQNMNLHQHHSAVTLETLALIMPVCVTHGTEGLQRYKVPTFFVGFLRLNSVLLTEGSIMRDLRVN